MKNLKMSVSILTILILPLLLAGCPGGKLDPNPQPLDFGKVYVGVTASGTAVWTNNGSVNSVLSGMLVDPSPTFSLLSAVPNETVKAGSDSTAFSFAFAPTSTGAAEGSATLIASNVPPKKLKLKGEGVYQKIGTTASLGGGDLAKDDALDFKEVILTQTKSLTFSVKNGDAANPITVAPAWKNGGVPFAITAPAGNVTVPAKGETKVTVSFTPKAVVDYLDVLEFTDTKDGKNFTGVVVKGRGVKGE